MSELKRYNQLKLELIQYRRQSLLIAGDVLRHWSNELNKGKRVTTAIVDMEETIKYLNKN